MVSMERMERMERMETDGVGEIRVKFGEWSEGSTEGRKAVSMRQTRKGFSSSSGPDSHGARKIMKRV